MRNQWVSCFSRIVQLFWGINQANNKDEAIKLFFLLCVCFIGHVKLRFIDLQCCCCEELLTFAKQRRASLTEINK